MKFEIINKGNVNKTNKYIKLEDGQIVLDTVKGRYYIVDASGKDAVLVFYSNSGKWFCFDPSMNLGRLENEVNDSKHHERYKIFQDSSIQINLGEEL